MELFFIKIIKYNIINAKGLIKGSIIKAFKKVDLI
jgi:hypothetical protein